MKKKVLITGGTGFQGKRVALTMKDDHEVTLGARNNKQNFLAGELTGCASKQSEHETGQKLVSTKDYLGERKWEADPLRLTSGEKKAK